MQEGYIALGGYDKQVSIYEISSARLVHVIDAHTNRFAKTAYDYTIHNSDVEFAAG